MDNSVTATYAKNNLGEIINKVMTTKKRILIKKAGKPAVYVTPVNGEYELDLTPEEIDGIEKGMKEFRKSFRMGF